MDEKMKGTKADLDLTSTIHLGSREVVEQKKSNRLHESLAKLTEEESNVVANLTTGGAMLIVHRGTSKGARYLITRDAVETRIGRAPESEIFLDDVTVSRKHAMIYERESVFSLRDEGSLNGTYVNGEPKIDVILHSGDEVQIGKFHMIFFGGNT